MKKCKNCKKVKARKKIKECAIKVIGCFTTADVCREYRRKWWKVWGEK